MHRRTVSAGAVGGWSRGVAYPAGVLRSLALAALCLAVIAPAAGGVPAAPSSLRGKTIVVDPGHNPGNASHPESTRPVKYGEGTKPCDATGTSTNDGYPEYAYNWDVSRRLVAILRRAGARVVLTRGESTPSWGPCITERAAIGNRVHADAAISIHADGAPASVRGYFTIAPASPIPAVGLTAAMIRQDVRLATAVRDAFGPGTGTRISNSYGGTGIYRSNDYGGTNLSKVPKIFLESANMRNAADARLLRSPAWRQRAAAAIAAGLARFLR